MKNKPKPVSKVAVRPAGPAVHIDFEEVTKLIGLVDEKKLSHFELETQGFKIIIGRHPGPPPAYHLNSVPAEPGDYPPPARPAAEAPEAPEAEPKPDLHYVTSPMVGTFYRAPDPAAPPFVDIGDEVEKKQTLCIVEAMKLMNEIESDVEGVVKEIYVENGKPVEFGQRLFGIQLTG
jgi:acetyl-CoA carboxylase biotin carboxyl carrier protein